MFFVSTAQNLIFVLESYQPCLNDQDCKENSFCYNNDDDVLGKCKCLKGFDIIRNDTSYECIAGMLFLGISRDKELRLRKTDNSRLSNINVFVFGISHIYSVFQKCTIEFNSFFTGARLEEACQKDIQCTITAGPLAICNEYKICGCENESTGKDGICYKKTSTCCACRFLFYKCTCFDYLFLELGETCSHDNNCYLSDGNYGFCVLGVCSCRNDQKPSADKTLCGNAMKLGEPCTNDEECNTVPNTRCLEKCRCSVEYTMSKNQSSCVKGINILR
jgi:hypothetical protein